MLLATGSSFYADVAERMLYNGLLAGVSLGGAEYFYVNPLQLREGAHADENRSPAHGRRGWFDCACCPPNIMRTLSSLDGYLATSDAEGVQLQLYAPSELTVAVAGGDVRLTVETDYPWDELVRVRVQETPGDEWTLRMRVPGWADGATLSVAGETQAAAAGGYATVRRRWSAGDVVELVLPMPVRMTEADVRVDAVRGCVAVERGPLVYAVEQVDQPEGVVVDDLRLDPAAPVRTEHRADLLSGVTVVHAGGISRSHSADAWPYRPATGGHRADDPGQQVSVVAVPYFAWANRGIGPMRVWVPRA